MARVLLADSLPGANWPGSEKAVNRVPVLMMTTKFPTRDHSTMFVRAFSVNRKWAEHDLEICKHRIRIKIFRLMLRIY